MKAKTIAIMGFLLFFCMSLSAWKQERHSLIDEFGDEIAHDAIVFECEDTTSLLLPKDATPYVIPELRFFIKDFHVVSADIYLPVSLSKFHRLNVYRSSINGELVNYIGECTIKIKDESGMVHEWQTSYQHWMGSGSTAKVMMHNVYIDRMIAEQMLELLFKNNSVRLVIKDKTTGVVFNFGKIDCKDFTSLEAKK